ncbi:hypothetical protein [Holospora elegans]|nr:hypothetical protein [Holospora elegans]
MAMCIALAISFSSAWSSSATIATQESDETSETNKHVSKKQKEEGGNMASAYSDMYNVSDLDESTQEEENRV